MESRTVNLSNKNAFAGANLGVPFSPMEAVTSLDPKDYVWTNPLLNWQVPGTPLAPGHPLGGVPTLPSLMPAPTLPQPTFFPGFGAFPWCGLQGLCQRPAVPSAAPQIPLVNVGQQQDLLQNAGAPMIPVETPLHTDQRTVEKSSTPVKAASVFNSVSSSELLKCCMEDDELKQLLEDPLDVAFEGLASDSSNASCLTIETSSPDPDNEGVEEDFLSLADLNFAPIENDDDSPGTGARTSIMEPMKRARSIPRGYVNWGVKKKRSTRRLLRRADIKSLKTIVPMDCNVDEVALIELEDMLWDTDARALPVGTACLISETKGHQECEEPGPLGPSQEAD